MALTEEFKKSPEYQEIMQDVQQNIAGMMMERMQKDQAMRVKNYQTLNRMAEPGGVLFTGSSLMEQFPIVEMCVSAGVKFTFAGVPKLAG